MRLLADLGEQVSSEQLLGAEQVTTAEYSIGCMTLYSGGVGEGGEVRCREENVPLTDANRQHLRVVQITSK